MKKGPKHGKNLRKGNGWRLIHKDRMFCATLLHSINIGNKRVAIFSVPKRHTESTE